ncbi:hypothetical protein LJD47_25545, partial [Escherichia coli]|nr:hypothetical protein [Escherichia coli]
YAIDLTDHEEAEARRRWPGLYQHLLRSVKAARVAQAARAPTKDALDYVARWWQFGKPRPELRAALTGLARYIGTVETAKHRVFCFIDAGILPDNMITCIASDRPFHLGILSSRISLEWTYANSGLIGVARFEQG